MPRIGKNLMKQKIGPPVPKKSFFRASETRAGGPRGRPILLKRIRSRYHIISIVAVTTLTP
jgi:hypothetical protein